MPIFQVNLLQINSLLLHIHKTLKLQGLRVELLRCVFHAIILNKITHAIWTWYGFLNKNLFLQINSLFKRAFKYGYVKSVYKLELFLKDYDKLFIKAFGKNHAMYHLLPSPKSTCYNLRSLEHGLSVSLVKSELHKKTFIYRVLFSESYWYFCCA